MEMSPLLLVALVIPLTSSVTLVKEQQLSVKVHDIFWCYKGSHMYIFSYTYVYISLKIVPFTLFSLSNFQILILPYNFHVKMEVLDYRMDPILLKAELKCASTMPGEQFVTTASVHLMHMLYAKS